ncbi:MAG: hypothetical protein E7043_04345 [Lentisphaerae bacterium]|nr:hypothetical protein [Lentisphaerota bacterium]
MEKQDVTIAVNVEQKKSNAAWICGLIGFITSIPNSFCAFLCAGAATAASGISAGLNAEGNEFNETAANVAAEEAARGTSGLLWIVLIISIACFILSFMGKSKNSVVTGVLLILGALFILINGFVGLGSMLWGTATGALYLVSGIVSITNRNKA